MGRKILLWFGGIVFFFLVLGVAMPPLEENPDILPTPNAAVSTMPTPAVSSEPNAEPENVVLPPVPEPTSTPEPVSVPEPIVSPTPEPTATVTQEQADYVLNINSEKFHDPSCASVDLMSEKNKRFFIGTREEVLEQGFDPCQNCNP